MMTSSNGNIFPCYLPLWLESTGDRGFDVFFDLCLNKESTIEAPVIWDAIAFIMTSL